MGSVASSVYPSTPKHVYTPLLIVVGLIAVSLTSRVQQNDILQYSVWGAAAFLLVWQLVLLLKFRSSGQTKGFLFGTPKPQHYLQAMVHLSIYLYWGYYWRPVYDYTWLLIAQLLFAYGFDILLSWSRGKDYLLGFGPFPIIFSTNLFLWFLDDWYYLQFLVVGVGFLGKEFVRWNRDGKRVHIFNPSAFTLGIFSIGLIATGTTDITRGQDIASTLTLAPNIYLYLFGTGLIVMYFFSITLVAASAAVTLFGLSALYSLLNGVPYFLDSEIPAAVFLGLHLLVTDPSTSPRTPPGKLIFGVLYGLGVFALYSLLTQMGLPTFYDKLLCVPLLNLSVQFIDRIAKSIHYTPFLEKIGLDRPSRKANLVHMALWMVFFGVMSVTGRADGRHTGDALPFWQQACTENKANACDRLILLENTYCSDGSGWACNALGIQNREGSLVRRNEERALAYFGRSCELRFQAACLNLLNSESTLDSNPRDLDLRLLLREGGLNLLAMPEPELYERACEHGWEFACER